MDAKKSLGQNFLMHQATAERIADAAKLPHDAVVLEIGPGTGMLTRALMARVKTVVAVEADDALAPLLTDAFPDKTKEGRLQVIHADFREFDLSHLPKGYAVVANIPYYITGEIIRKLLEAKNKPSSVTLLVQKEVAERIARDPKESLLSLSVKAYGTPSYAFTVPRGAFRPAPKVDSAVLHISGVHSPFSSRVEEERFFEILHAGFAHKRKQLLGNLEPLSDKETIASALHKNCLRLDVRAEDVPLSAWVDFVGIFSGKTR